jgi:hypothetical protein
LRSKKLDLQNNLISEESFDQSLQAYLGVLKHCNGWSIGMKIENILEDNNKRDVQNQLLDE